MPYQKLKILKTLAATVFTFVVLHVHGADNNGSNTDTQVADSATQQSAPAITVQDVVSAPDFQAVPVGRLEKARKPQDNAKNAGKNDIAIPNSLESVKASNETLRQQNSALLKQLAIQADQLAEKAGEAVTAQALQAKVAELEEDMVTLVDQLTASSIKVSELTQQLERSREAYTDKLSEQTRPLESHIASLEKQLAQAVAGKAQADSQLSSAKFTVPLLYMIITGVIALLLLVMYIQKSSQTSTLVQQVSDHQKSQERFKKEMDARGKVIDRLNEKRATESLLLENEKKRHADELRDVQQAREVAEQKLAQINAEKAVEGTSINTLQAELKEKAEFIRSLNEQISVKAETIGNLKAQIAEHDTLKNELLIAQKTIDTLKQEVANQNTSGRREEDEKEIEQLNKEIDDLIHKLNKKEQDCHFLEDQVDDLKEELEELSLNAENARHDEEIDDEEDASEIGRLTDALHEAEQEMDNQERTIAELHDVINKVRNENEQFKSQLRKLQNEIKITH